MIDAMVMRELEEAQIASQIDEMRRHGSFEAREDITANLKAQLEAQGMEDPEGTFQAQTTTTAAPLTVWNRATGVSSRCTTDSVKALLLRRFPADHVTHAGEFVWTTTPMAARTTLKLLCPCHPKSEVRALLDSLGAADIVCGKPAGFRSLVDVERHFKSKHSAAYTTLKEHEAESQRLEGLEMQRLQTEALQQLASQGRMTTDSSAQPKQRMVSAEQKEALARGRLTAQANRAAKEQGERLVGADIHRELTAEQGG